MHKCQSGQWDLLNSDDDNQNSAKQFDVLLLQEPYIDYLGNPKATKAWKLVKPTRCSTSDDTHPRSIILVNARIPTDSWEEIHIDNGNHDITAIQLKGTFGRLTIFNIYNNQNHSRTLRLMDNFIDGNKEKIVTHANDYIYLGGDFNRHHPLWESDENTQLVTARHIEKAQQIINIIAKHDLEQTLPKGIPTFYSNAHNTWTRPDNVFCSTNLVPSIITCDVANDQITGPGVDHMPIHTILDLKLLNIKTKPRYKFREADWKFFNEKLKTNLENSNIPEIINDEASFHMSISELTRAIQKTIPEAVELSNPVPLSKRWWNSELANMKRNVRRLGAEHFKYRTIPDHPSHSEFKKASNKYSDSIKKQKLKHWEEYLTKSVDGDVPTINFFISEPPTDGSSTRIPTLRFTDPNGQQKEASTNEDKTKALSQAFFPPKPANLHIPPDYQYPEPIDYPCKITKERILHQIACLSPYKAAGPDGIPNAVWKYCKDQLTPILTRIFKASIELKTYSPSWKEWTTVVLKKPGKPRYDNPKAWRPIALMNTMGKLLTALIAEDLSYMCELHQLIPDRHFRGRPGRTTTDAIHLLTHRIKAAWRRKKVVSVLFLDIEGAFPNAVLDRLLHNMKKRRIPDTYVQFTKRQLEDRRTKLSFDDYTSDWITINNGTGQGDPASMYDYIIYDADLVDETERELSCNMNTIPTPDSARERNTQEKEEDAAAFVDDTWLLAEGDSFVESNATLKDMMEREGGAMEWSLTHNSKFELSKTTLMGFTNKRIPCPFRVGKTIPAPRPSLNIRGTTIKPTTTTRYLGIKIDQELKWAEQAKAVIEKATKWTLAFRRMAQPSKGVSAKLMLKLYKTVLIPKLTYGIDTWFKPISNPTNGKRRQGSVGVLKQLTKIQRIAAIAITGALKSTATDVLEIHAGILPMELTLQKACQRAALRLATLPPSHPLHKPVKTSARRILKRHAGPLHYIMALCPYQIEEIEKIEPIRKPPAYNLPAKIIIASTRELSRTQDRNDNADMKLYSDGSAFEGGVGASAVMYRSNRQPKTLKYHLGPIDNYTVANAEAVGTCLAVHLASNPMLTTPKTITFNIDSQATIKGLSIRKPKPGQYLLLKFLDALDKLKARNPGTKIKIRWTSAHDGIEGNEKADEEAKEAARGESSITQLLPRFLRPDSQLPISISAIKQKLNEDTNKKWKDEWEKSPRHRKLQKYDKDPPNSKFLKKTKGMPRKHISLLTQMRTGHIPLRNHLYRINKADTPQCLACFMSTETLSHFVLECTAYRRERFLLRLLAGRNARNLEYLLNTPKGMKHIIKYTGLTKRFHKTYGPLDLTNQDNDQQPEDETTE